MEKLQKTHAFFERYGERVILISRFIPIVRHFISIPAGAGKMNIWKFCLYTVIGSTLWNSIILALGYSVGSHSESLTRYTHLIDRGVLAIAALGLAGMVLRQKKKRVS